MKDTMDLLALPPDPKNDGCHHEIVAEHSIKIGGRQIECWTTADDEVITIEGRRFFDTYQEACQWALREALTKGNKWE